MGLYKKLSDDTYEVDIIIAGGTACFLSSYEVSLLNCIESPSKGDCPNV
jgi:hypothetical protein